MQKIYFNKLVNLNHELKELQSISVDESINYKLEKDGIRAIGSINITGEYKNQSDVKKFDDSIELDIFADFKKIVDKRDFLVKVDDFDYSLIDGNLQLKIQASVHSVKDDEDRIIEMDDTAMEIENLMNEIEVNDKKAIERSDIIENKVIEQVKDDNTEDEDIGIYYFYVVNDGDTYTSIAYKYKVEEDILKEYNHFKDISSGDIVIVPYQLC